MKRAMLLLLLLLPGVAMADSWMQAGAAPGSPHYFVSERAYQRAKQMTCGIWSSTVKRTATYKQDGLSERQAANQDIAFGRSSGYNGPLTPIELWALREVYRGRYSSMTPEQAQAAYHQWCMAQVNVRGMSQ